MPISKADAIIVDESFEPKNAEDVLYKYKAIIIQALTDKLIRADKDQPGVLLQSIDVLIHQNGEILSLTLSMEDYWKYVDQGRRPGARMPPTQPILDFIKVRGIKGNPKKVKPGLKSKRIRKAVRQVNRDKALKQVAFLIARGIKKHGIKPTHFYSDTVNQELKDQLKYDLTQALKKDIEVIFKDVKEQLS